MTKGLIEKPSDASSKLVQKALADQRSVIETYLFEYCEKNNIPESELRGRLGIVSCTEDRYIGVVNCTEPDKILIGAKIEKTLEGFHVSVFGSENLEKDYPKEDSVQYDKENIPYVYKAILHIQAEKGVKYQPSVGEINRVASYIRASQ